MRWKRKTRNAEASGDHLGRVLIRLAAPATEEEICQMVVATPELADERVDAELKALALTAFTDGHDELARTIERARGVVASTRGEPSPDGEITNRIRLAESMLEEFEKLADTPELADVHRLLAQLYFQNSDWPRSLLHNRALRDICRRARDRKGEAQATANMGIAAYKIGSRRDADRLLGEALALFQRLGDQEGVRDTLYNLSLMGLPR